jgi:hypothetical protein
MSRLVDYSAERIPSRPKIKMVNGKPETFKPGEVQGIMLHQTACYFGSDKESDEWLGHRALKVATHLTVFRNGLIAVNCPLEWITNHGNEPNRMAWGIEVEGKYRGQPGAFGHDQKALTVEASNGLQEALRYLMGRAATLGHTPRFLWAHRQSSDTRRSDPGYEIWQAALPVAQELGLRTHNARTWDQGRPIPRDWDPRSQRPY